MQPLTTSRMLLRPLSGEDVAPIVALLSDDPKGVGMTIAIRWPVTVDDTAAWIAAPKAPGVDDLAMVLRRSGEFLGCISSRRSAGTVSLGYWLGKPYRRQGYVGEALATLITHACREGCRTARADVFQGNAASAAVLERAGFRQFAASRQHVAVRGKTIAVRHFARDLVLDPPGPLPTQP